VAASTKSCWLEELCYDSNVPLGAYATDDDDDDDDDTVDTYKLHYESAHTSLVRVSYELIN